MAVPRDIEAASRAAACLLACGCILLAVCDNAAAAAAAAAEAQADKIRYDGKVSRATRLGIIADRMDSFK
jgi:hypothetical protein